MISMARYWFCILTPENYQIVRENLVWGVKDRHKKVLDQVSIGDKLIMYVIGEKKIKGIFEVVSEPYRDESEIFKGGVFPNRVKLKLVKEGEGIDIKELVPELKIFKRKDEKWAGILRGRAMIELDEEDYKKIEEKL